MSLIGEIDCAQLDAELQRTKGAFDSWALNKVSAADQLCDSHKRNISDLRGVHPRCSTRPFDYVLMTVALCRRHPDSDTAQAGTEC